MVFPDAPRSLRLLKDGGSNVARRARDTFVKQYESLQYDRKILYCGSSVTAIWYGSPRLVRIVSPQESSRLARYARATRYVP